jgi:DNA-binding IclR family transcriptional regulator
LFLVGIEGPMFLNTGWRSGTRMPLHATAAGRILLAFMGEGAAAAVLRGDLPALTPKTVTDPGALHRSLEDIRQSGIAFQHGESIPDLTGAAVPLFGIRRALIGTLSVVLPSHLHVPNEEGRLRDTLHRSARTLSQRMGCDVYPFGH